MNYYTHWLHLRHGVGIGIPVAVLAVFVFTIAYSAWADVKTLLIPVWCIVVSIGLAAASAPLLWSDWRTHLVSGAVCALAFYSLANLKVRGKYGFGMGDAYLYTACGLMFGKGVMITILGAAILGLIGGIAIIVRGGHGRDHKIAHAPFIVAGVVLAIAAGALA